ncbi:homoserine O-acetyltransferase [Tsukamurella pulmonis]|uniref:Homoserine O-acetyltransferase n=1 Tax=Tsukamurella pulmonis TaxID=47312 RepID=A0A1H1GYQ1_9ACTN|nr:homoserine O-acetyltransferase [Tsukamurella pulmonis]KXP13134.1 homoserine O-acetyltransferase [Tsukamurella pulmonis]BDD81392.1 homoserine O-acetyltransferase [Tsukamurella pulmonis]SDR18280.1 homoserine O-acetyltransferase [Tsukamurella pulmonis]SUP16333.1 Homoserine O-acetyltransferase [Tsukamurella pulmonis]
MTISTRTGHPIDSPPGDWARVPDGALQSLSLGPLVLESGVVLPDVTMTFQRWGRPNAARDNVVLTLHALTGDSHVTGPPDDAHRSAGWWDGLIGPGAAVDTDEWCVVSANVLGGCSGSTGPASLAPDGRPYGSRFPVITVRDQVEAEAALLRALDVHDIAAVVGGSMGGARALEWALMYGDFVRSALVLAVGARATADQIGTQTTQIAAIKADPHWRGGDYYDADGAPTAGLGIARRIAHLTYRTEIELDSRFENRPQGDEDPHADGRYAVTSYLDHQADKLVGRFDAGSYVVLTDVLNHHDVGRGRGGVEAALRACPVPVVVGGIDSDRLYPLRLQQELAALLPGSGEPVVVHSRDGHDGFLTEMDAVAGLLRRTLDLARR